MKEFVLDASVTLNWCFPDEQSEYSENILKLLTQYSASVPFIWTLEILNVLLVSERRNRITADKSDRFLYSLSQLPIIVDSSKPELSSNNLLTTARKFDLSIYDTTYLELAIRRKLPIATKDKKMLEVISKIGIDLFEF